MLIKQVKTLGKEEIERLHILLLEAYPVAILPYLIYFDENYSCYLAKIIDDYPNNIFFIVKMEDTLIGFAHFKLIGEDLFLNNIAIDKEYRGKGLGKFLLNASIAQIKQEFSLKTFSLDVFGKNENAYKWYRKMGLKEINQTYWYNVHPHLEKYNINPTPGSNLIIKEDDNGFKGFYLDKAKIASIIGNETLIFRSLDAINKLGHSVYNKFLNFCLISKNREPFRLLEVSKRLSADINLLKL